VPDVHGLRAWHKRELCCLADVRDCRASQKRHDSYCEMLKWPKEFHGILQTLR
jgi:hypothetical protein